MENVPPLSDLTQYINPEIHNVHPAVLFAQSSLGMNQKKHQRPDTYKTVMCQAWLESTRCAFGADCKFAHGETELRPAKLPIRNTLKYKTKLCDKYTTTGICPYGSRCLFIHPDPRSSAYYRQTAIAQQLLQQTLGMMSASGHVSQSSSPPYNGTPPTSLAPSPPKNNQQNRPPSGPHPSWPLDANSVFMDEMTTSQFLNYSRSLPNSRHSSISPYSHESSGSTTGAWTLF